MNTTDSLAQVVNTLPPEVLMRSRMSLAIANRIEFLMKMKGLNKKQFAEGIGHRPSEVTKWLSGEHNFTVATLAKISSFFDESIINVL